MGLTEEVSKVIRRFQLEEKEKMKKENGEKERKKKSAPRRRNLRFRLL